MKPEMLQTLFSGHGVHTVSNIYTCNNISTDNWLYCLPIIATNHYIVITLFHYIYVSDIL